MLVCESWKPVVWSSQYSVGVDAIDDDHKKLIHLFNDLLSAFANGSAERVLRDTIARAIDYTETHFAKEEAFLQQISFPFAVEHQREHRALRCELDRIAARLSAGRDHHADAELVAFLGNWVVTHVLDHDQAYFAHLRSIGAIG